MNGGQSGTAAAGGLRPASRLMLLVADGCRVCVGLDSVDGVFDLVPADSGGATALPDGTRVPLLDWSTVAGVAPPVREQPPQRVMVVRTPAGPVGLAADSCLGVREASLEAMPLLATRLIDESGEPLCFVHLLDRKPYFLVDPRALAIAARRQRAPAEPEA